MTVRIGSKYIGKDERVVLFEVVFTQIEDRPEFFDDAIYLINGIRTNITDYKMALATLSGKGDLR